MQQSRGNNSQRCARSGFSKIFQITYRGNSLRFLRADNDVVDRDVDELHEEADEAHYAEANGRRNGDLLEFTSIGLGATLHQTDRVLGEEAAGLAELDDLIHFLWRRRGFRSI